MVQLLRLSHNTHIIIRETDPMATIVMRCVIVAIGDRSIVNTGYLLVKFLVATVDNGELYKSS